MGAGETVAAHIRRHGPLAVRRVVELALYDPDHGFYATGGAAGRRAATSSPAPRSVPCSERCWPGPTTSGGTSSATRPVHRGRLRRRHRHARERHSARGARVPGRADLRARGAVAGPAGPSRRSPVALGTGARARTASWIRRRTKNRRGPNAVRGRASCSLDSMPALSIVGVVTANELLDNLPFAVVERAGAEWLEVRVALDADQQDLIEQLVPAPERLARDAEALVPGAADGARFPIQTRATTWLRNALAHVGRGRVLVLDYASTTPALAGRPSREWLRTYREHERGGSPLDQLGTQDITVDVCVDQLTRCAPRSRPDASGVPARPRVGRVGRGGPAHVERASPRRRPRGPARAEPDPRGGGADRPDGLGSFRVLDGRSAQHPTNWGRSG